jgi:hypothetical protein
VKAHICGELQLGHESLRAYKYGMLNHRNSTRDKLRRIHTKSENVYNTRIANLLSTTKPKGIDIQIPYIISSGDAKRTSVWCHC